MITAKMDETKMMTKQLTHEEAIQHQYELYLQKKAAKEAQETSKFVPPFKRLNQKELLECLQHGWVGKFTLVKPSTEPPKEGGKYARMAYDMSRKSPYVSALVFPAEGRIYRQVNFAVVAALEKKGLVAVTYVSECEGVFQLKPKEEA